MVVGLAQFRADKGDIAGSRRALVALAHQAARGAQLVVLPEMAATGYVYATPEAVRAVAEPVDGPTGTALAEVARTHQCWLVAGFPELAGDKLFNSAFVFDPRGQRRFVYRKTMLYDADLPWASPGDSGYQAFDTEGGRFGVGICMDLNDDAFIGWIGDSAVDAVAFPTNWVDKPPAPPEAPADTDPPLHTFTYWAWRMHGQRAALLAANTWGEDGGYRFSGESAVLRQGRILGALPPVGDGTLQLRL